MTRKNIEFMNGNGLKLKGIVHIPKRYDTAVIICHGFPSNYEGSTSTRAARDLEKEGYLVLRFNFSHTPPSEGKFEDKLMSREVKDIRHAIDYLFQHFKFKRLILVGHSTGAIDVSLYAYRDKRVSKIILSGAVSDLKHASRYDFTDEQIKSFWERGYVRYNLPGRWWNGKKIKKRFYDEFFTLNIPAAMKRYRKPLLILHGEKDEAIPSGKDPHELYELARKPKRLVIIKDADHSYKRAGWNTFISHVKRFIKE